MKPNLYIFDIETIAVESALLEALMPKELAEPHMPPELEKPAVPVFRNGTLAKGKGADAEAKHHAWKEDKMAAWREEHKAKIEKWNEGNLDKRLKWIDTACLRAETAVVPLICGHDPKGTIGVFFIGTTSELNLPELLALNPVILFACDSEAKLLADFWHWAMRVREEDESAKFAGWNSSRAGGFDLAMLKRRSWINRVRVSVGTHGERGYASDHWLDLMEQWQCGDRQLYASADSVARALGCTARKTDHGGNFGAMWKRSKTEAIMYCMSDVLCEREIAEAMGYTAPAAPVPTEDDEMPY